ncbi:MAG: ATP-binding protein [Pseudomonadales bacterium]|nr:ATP-binding protein [Pseudomonadales bacterium]
MTSLRVDVQELVRRLLRLVPGAADIDWSTSPAAVWRSDRWGGRFIAHNDLDDISLDDLLCIDDQKAALMRNTRQFLEGAPANNALLWGARGTGKSSLIHGLLNACHSRGLRLVEVSKESLGGLADIVQVLSGQPYRFILFCDDLSFEAEDASYKSLKSALEGSVFRSSDNVLIYATSNRRHLLPEYMTDNEQASFVGGELHQGEAVEEKISLSDRFGLWLSFYPFKQDAYLQVAEYWVGRLAEKHAIDLRWDEEARAVALRWALARGVRNGRTAQYFARDWVGGRILER